MIGPIGRLNVIVNRSFGLLDRLCGVQVEVRGTIPSTDVVVISKHQSFLDVMMHAYFMPCATFVMKQELRFAPIFGFYAMRIGVAPVKRGDKGKAVGKMLNDVERNSTERQQLVIYPQGTRVPPGQHAPYKVGAGVLAERTGRQAVMAATNTGLFWPKYGPIRGPGVAVVEYLAAVPDGLNLNAFIEHIEIEIESASDRLVQLHNQDD